MKIKIDKKQVIKEEKHRPIQRKNIFGDEDSLEDASPNQMLSEEEYLRYVQRVLSEELQDVIAEEVNPRELLKKVCAKKGMIIKAIQNKQVGDLIWWAEALGYVPEEMEELRVNLEKLLGTTPDEILDNPIAMAAAVGAIEMACVLGESKMSRLLEDESNWDKLLKTARSFPASVGKAGHSIGRLFRRKSRKKKTPEVGTPIEAAPEEGTVTDTDLIEGAVEKLWKAWEQLDAEPGDWDVEDKKQLNQLMSAIKHWIRTIRKTGDPDDQDELDEILGDLGELRAEVTEALKSIGTADTGTYGKSLNWSLGPVSVEGRARYRKFYSDLKKYDIDPKLLGRADYVWGPKHDRAYQALVKAVNA